MDKKLSKIYYSPKGYWKGTSAIKKLADKAKVSEKEVKKWLSKQAVWQVYLPPPKHIRRPKFDIETPNEVHQADLLFLPHDKVNRKTYKYALTVVDVASRYKEAEPLQTKTAAEVAVALNKIYKRSPLKFPNLIQVDPGREFLGAFKTQAKTHGSKIRYGRVDIHRDQAIVERWNRTLAERLFGHQYAIEMRLPEGERSTEWVKRLPSVVAAQNQEVTRLIGMKPVDAVKEKSVTNKRASRPGRLEPRLPSDALVRYLYAPGELEGGQKRATDPIWSLKTYEIDHVITKPGEPKMYWLRAPAPDRSFVREELLVVPRDTELPPTSIL